MSFSFTELELILIEIDETRRLNVFVVSQSVKMFIPLFSSPHIQNSKEKRKERKKDIQTNPTK